MQDSRKLSKSKNNLPFILFDYSDSDKSIKKHDNDKSNDSIHNYKYLKDKESGSA